jgi:hypothetical protein
MKVHTFYYKDIFPISFKNGMVNATEMANAFGKRPVHYLKSRSAKTYVYSFDYDKVLHVTQVENKEEICWMSLELALDFSEWLDLEFSRFLELIIKKNYKNILK